MRHIIYSICIIYFYVDIIIGNSNSPITFGDNSTTRDKCLTKECHIDRLRASLSILLYMNESVSPCDNFYEFVCGNYEKVSKIDNNMPFTMTQKNSDQIVNKNLYHSIKKINVTTEKFRPRRLVKEFFDMCMDTKTREYQGIKSLMEIIKKLHGWPLVEGDAWNDSNWRLENVYNEAKKLGVPTSSFLFNVKPFDLTGTYPSLLRLHRPKAEFDKEHLSNPIGQDKAINGYYDFMMNMALNGFKIPPSTAIPQLLEVYNFEMYLTKAFPDGKSLLGNITSIRQIWKNIDWDTIFNLSTYGIEIDNISEMIIMPNQQYLNFINSKLPPKRVLANYHIWKFIQFAAPNLNSEISQMKKDYLKVRYGEEAVANSRWESCIIHVRKSLPHLADAIFMQDNIDKDIKREILEMIENIKEQFMKTLNSISWLDESSREWAMAKLNATRYLVAYPNEAYDKEKLEKLYEDYEIVDGDFLKTVLRFKYLSQKRIMTRYKSYNSTGYKEFTPWIDANSHYVPIKNMILILAGNLQDDMYNKNRPKYVSYSTVGSSIGHEMSHNFDVDGLDYDKDGLYQSEDPFNTTVRTMYQNKMDCLVDHYSRYKYPKTNVTVKSNLTIDESMADVNGIRLAYHAYQQWVKNHGPEPNLPDLNFTANQLYWISYAHAYCSTFSLQDVIDFSYDAHPTDDIRVMGSVSNSPEFAADFNCPVNSKMNPIKKCTFT